MANWGQKVYPSDYAEIKALLKAEVDHTRKWGANHSEQAEPSGSSAKRAELDPGNCCIKRVLWPLLWPVFHGMQYGLHELHRLLHGELHWILCGIVRQ